MTGALVKKFQFRSSTEDIDEHPGPLSCAVVPLVTGSTVEFVENGRILGATNVQALEHSR